MSRRTLNPYRKELMEEILEMVKANYDILGIDKSEDYFEAVKQGISSTIGFLDDDILENGQVKEEILERFKSVG